MIRHYSANDRQQVYKSAAESLGWHFEPEGGQELMAWMKDFQLFRIRSRRNKFPVIRVENEALEKTCLFDYSYTVSTNNSSRTFRQTVYFRYAKDIALPHFVMVPEKWYHQIGKFFGMQDINFVEYPDFSRHYLLRGKDEDYIRHHFNHPELIRFFGQQNFYSLEGLNYLMILYIHDVVLPPAEMIRLVHIGDAIHDFFRQKTPDIRLPEGIQL